MAKQQKIVRTPTRVEGPVTPAEQVALEQHAAMWIDRIMRTDPIEPDKIIPAVKALYAAAGLAEPRVVIVPSPLVMAVAGGFASALWGAATMDATRDATMAATGSATRAATGAATGAATWAATGSATRAATGAATRAATSAATRAATSAATRDATWAATGAATRAATRDATRDATRGATEAATALPYGWAAQLAGVISQKHAPSMLQAMGGWSSHYSGGNMWAQYDSWITAMRDVMGLRLPEHEKYAAWEQCAVHGGFRYLHEKFCMVSDFPEVLKVDERNRPHCEDGPSHRWRDGWELYHWHGVRVDRRIVMAPESITVAEALAEENADVRRVMFARIGGARLEKELPVHVIDESPDVSGHPRRLYEIKGVDGVRYVDLEDHIGQKHIARAVPPEVRTCDEAVAWRRGAIDFEDGIKVERWAYQPSIEG